MIWARFSLALSAVVMIASTSGCGPVHPKPRLTDDDVKALERVYDTSGRGFRYSDARIEVRGDGLVELEIKGDAFLDPDEESLWVPLALSPELPEYFRRGEEVGQVNFELDAYKVADGHWCITAAIPASELRPSIPDGKLRTSAPLRLRILMFSRSFATAVPFMIPNGPRRTNLDVSVNLPKGARFHSAEVQEGAAPSELRKLSILPASLTGGTLSAAASLQSPNAVAWDLSGVRFTVPPAQLNWPRWWYPSAALIVLVCVAGWLRLERVRRLDKKQFVLANAVSASAQAASETLQEIIRSTPSEGLSSLPTLAAVLAQLSILRQAGPLAATASKPILDKESLSDLKTRLLQLPNAQAERVGLAQAHLDALRGTLERFDKCARRRSTWVLCFWFLVVIAGAASAWLLLATVARAQSSEHAPSKQTVGSATLFELAMLAEPEDPASPDRDTVKVRLKFLPFTDSKRPTAPSEIEVGSGLNTGIRIEPAELVPGEGTSVVRKTDKLVRFAVPARYSAMSKRLRALSGQRIEQYRPPKEYFDASYAGSLVTIQYRLQGAQRVNSRAGIDWFYWFPFDTLDVEIPLELDAAAILSRIEVRPPAGDYDVGKPRVDGLALAFARAASGSGYESINADANSRLFIAPGKPITVQATFERTGLQRSMLIGGVLSCSILLGFLLGLLLTFPKDHHVLSLIGVIPVFAIPFVVRSQVFSKYDQLPTIVTGQGLTVFETVWIVSVVIMAIIALVTYKWIKNRRPRR